MNDNAMIRRSSRCHDAGRLGGDDIEVDLSLRQLFDNLYIDVEQEALPDRLQHLVQQLDAVLRTKR